MQIDGHLGLCFSQQSFGIRCAPTVDALRRLVLLPQAHSLKLVVCIPSMAESSGKKHDVASLRRELEGAAQLVKLPPASPCRQVAELEWNRRSSALCVSSLVQPRTLWEKSGRRGVLVRPYPPEQRPRQKPSRNRQVFVRVPGARHGRQHGARSQARLG